MCNRAPRVSRLAVLLALLLCLPSGIAFSSEGLEQRIIVGFSNDVRNNGAAVSAAVTDVANGQGLGLTVKRQLATGAHLLQVDRQISPRAIEALTRAFASRQDVKYAEFDAIMQAHVEPDDPRYNEQWHYYEATAGLNLPPAWDSSRGAGVVVAILDTGQTNHADLLANIIPGYDFISDPFVSRDGDGRDSDPRDEGDWNPRRGECYRGSPRTNSSWHGTHVAGTVAAVTDNGNGVAGVAPGASIQHVRVLGRCGGYLSDIADAIVWAAGGLVDGNRNPTPAQVINMSLGGGGSCGATYQAAINFAHTAGTTVVVSAGNSNADASGSRPASCNDVITVAASDRQGNRAYYSNYGNLVEITAPGGETATTSNGVLSTLNSGNTTPANDSYAFYQGTSMAAPHIAGLAALIYAYDGTATPDSVLALIQSTARDLPGSCSGGCGEGLADAGAAIAALNGVTPPPEPEPDPAPAKPTGLAATPGDGVITLNWNANSENDLDHYKVYKDGAPLTQTSATSYIDSAVSNGTAYEYEVTAVDTAGQESPPSDSVLATPEAEEPPDPPPVEEGGLSSSSTNEGRTWTARVENTDGTTLSGSWSSGSGGSCSGPACTLSGIRKNQGSVVFTRDSDGRQIIVLNP